jgi:hypothetical protein
MAKKSGSKFFPNLPERGFRAIALILHIFGQSENIGHTEMSGALKSSPNRTTDMKNAFLTIATMMALMCVGQAKEKLASATSSSQSNGQTDSKPTLGTIIVYRQWSFIGWGRPKWRFNVDNGPDLTVRNGTYLRVDVAPGDHVLDHSHMALFGSDPQTVHVKVGETVYFQYVCAPALVFEVADDQKQAAKTVSEMRSVEEALAHSRH